MPLECDDKRKPLRMGAPREQRVRAAREKLVEALKQLYQTRGETMTTPIRATGIAWYRREDYPRILAIMEDADVLADTWEEWFKKAKSLRDDARRQGMLVEQVTIDPDIFPDWCKARGLNVDAKARVAFANEQVALKFNQTH